MTDLYLPPSTKRQLLGIGLDAKPVAPVAIDRTNKFGARCVFAALPHGAHAVDLVSGIPGTLIGTGQSENKGGSKITDGTSYFEWTIQNELKDLVDHQSKDGCTLFSITDDPTYGGTGSSTGGMLCLRYTGEHGMSLGQGNGAAYRYLFVAGRKYAEDIVLQYGGANSLSQNHNILSFSCWSANGSNFNANAAVNGKEVTIGTVGTTYLLSWRNTKILVNYGHSTNKLERAFPGTNQADFIFSPALTVEEQLELHADPYQFIVDDWQTAFEFFGASSGLSLSPGAISSAEAFGAPSITAGAVTVSPGNIPSAEAFGAHTVTGGAITLSPGAIASAEAFGVHQLSPGAVALLPGAIASAEAFGVLSIAPGAIALQPAGIGTGEAFGAVTVAPGSIIVLPTGIATLEAFGDALVIPGVSVLTPGGIASAEAFGTVIVTGGAVAIGRLIAAIRIRAALGGSNRVKAALSGSNQVNAAMSGTGTIPNE